MEWRLRCQFVKLLANYSFLFCKSLAYFHFANYEFLEILVTGEKSYSMYNLPTGRNNVVNQRRYFTHSVIYILQDFTPLTICVISSSRYIHILRDFTPLVNGLKCYSVYTVHYVTVCTLYRLCQSHITSLSNYRFVSKVDLDRKAINGRK